MSMGDRGGISLLVRNISRRLRCVRTPTTQSMAWRLCARLNGPHAQ